MRSSYFRSCALVALMLCVGLAPFARAAMEVGNNFWFRESWSGETPFQSNVNFSTTTNPWNPTFIGEVDPYAVLRFMDWNKTNGSTEVTWADRMPKSGSQVGRVAYEWQIDLCNRIDSNLWVCLPHMSDSNYWTQLATLIKNQLEPGRKVFVEYSNETWNTAPQFPQGDWVINFAKTNGLVPAEHVGQSWENEVAKAYGHSYKIVRIGETFRNVFGTEYDTRVRVVLAGQHGNHWLQGQFMDAIQDPKVNPNGFQFHHYAVAPYIGGIDGADPQIESKWNSAITSTSGQLTEHRNLLAGTSMSLIAYEGGQHITTNSDVFARNSRAYNMYINYMNMLNNHLVVFAHYTHCGNWGSGGAWGAKAFTGQSTADAHKYRALIDWISANPPGPSNQVAAPGFSPNPGTYSSAQSVTISTSTSGASIRYTTDGSTPSSTAGTLYSGPVTIGSTTTLKAIAYKSGMTDSSITSGTYTINIPVTAAVAAGSATVDASIESAWSNATSYAVTKTTGTVSSTSDCSGSFRALWDSSNLYALVEVTDDNKSNDSTDPWADDSVEVYVDGGNNKTASYDSNDRQYIFGWNDSAVVEGGGRSSTGVSFAKADPSTTSYRIEARIPWSTLGVTKSAGQSIGLDVHINDDDAGGAREGKKQWNDSADTAWSNPSVFGTGTLQSGGTTVPAAPTGLTATAGNAQVALSWSASSGATSYNVKRSTTSGSGYTTIANPTTTSYTNTGLTNGTTYYYVVSAVNSAGESGNSNQASATPDGGTVAAPAFSPAPGTYSSSQSVTISSATSGASIRYTTDGSTPSSTSGTLYSGPVSISSTTTLKAIAYKSGMTNSSVTSGTYTISTSSGGPAGYTYVADEGQSHTFTQTVDLAYGANGSFNHLFGRTGTITFDNATFGDPIVGVVKKGYYKLVSTTTGSLTREVWNNVSGTSVSQIPLSTTPSSTGTITSFEAPTNVGDNYGQRVRGYITAPQTGSYTFWIAADDGCELWLSTNDQASSRVRIAYHTAWTNSREWNKYTTQKSASISLTAGTRYYVEALMKEGAGGDNLAVGWIKPGQSGTVPSEVVPGSVLTPWDGSNPPPPPSADSQIARAATVPTIDGSIDSGWGSATSYSLGNTLSGSMTASDLSVSWRGMWDGSYLYVLAEVTDDSKRNDSTNAWDDDSVELFVDGNNEKATSYDANDAQYVYGWNDSAVVAGSNTASGKLTGVSFAKSDPTTTSYRVETRVPWSSLGVTASGDKVIGIDVHCNDDDDGAGRDGKKSWKATADNSWSNPSTFGTGRLVP